MKPLYKGLIVAVVHLLIVSSLGAKLLIDRGARPRIWVQAASYDPDTPLRGRYASLQVNVALPPEKRTEIEHSGSSGDTSRVGTWMGGIQFSGQLEIRDGNLFVVDNPHGDISYVLRRGATGLEGALIEPIAFYLPEHVPDPTIAKPGRELWVEVTIPRKGPPRPIRLGYKENGKLTPLDLR